MRGEAEQNCFDLVKSNLDKDIFFAMSYKDRDLIKRIFEEATSNKVASSFPDFVYDDGFIEHFQVTSSKERRNGSKMEIEKAEIRRDFNARAKEATENLPEDSVTVHSVSTPQVWHQTHSYENFVESFKTNLEHHLNSMEKYSGRKDCKIFMVEYNDSALCMSKLYPKDLMLEVSYGDLMKRELPVYRLSRDKNLLRYLHEKKDLIDYLIFVNDNCFQGAYVDIIKTYNSLEIIKLLYEGYSPYCVMVGSSEFGIGVSIPNSKGEV